MNTPVFLSINQNFITEQIGLAEESIFLAIPGITHSISSALIESSKRLKGWDKINVVIDPSPKVYYLGYADLKAFKDLEMSGCSIKNEENLRIGILIVDGQVFVFSPISLNLESDEEAIDNINALVLEKKVSRSIIEAIVPSSNSNEPEIGKRKISEVEVRIVEKTIKNNPPLKPDLTRKINVLTSQFQFVDLSFKGSQLKNTKISLRARELGIVDEDLVKRISGQFKVFEQLPQNYEKGINDLKGKYRQIRDQFTKTIGDYGTIIWISQRKDFEDAIEELQKDIDKFNKSVIKEIVDEINISKAKLKNFISENYKENQQQSFDQKLAQIKKEKIIDDIVDKAFSNYTKEELEKKLMLKCHYYSISPQMASDEGFNKKIEELLDVKLDDLVKYEDAFGADERY